MPFYDRWLAAPRAQTPSPKARHPVKRPTILQIVPELDTGGAELSAIEITEAIVRAGGRALVLSEGGRLAPRIAACGGEFITFPAATKNPIRLLWNAYAMTRLVRREGVDLLHARSRAPAWSALIAARLTQKPFVTTYHGAYGENGALKRFYNSIMARGDIVIANSRYTAGLIRARYATPERLIRVIHRGVDPAVFDPAAVSPERIRALRSRLNLTMEDRVVLQAARLTGWKGQSVLIEAARRLKAENRLGRVVFVLAGDAQGRDAYRRTLEGLIAGGGLDGVVRLAGHVEDMPAAFAIAHVTVLASTEAEAFGRTATEAQAMGCPVISTNLGAPPETVLAAPRIAPEAITGWLVPPGDAVALAEALAQSLALGPAQRTEMGRRARTHATVEFSLAAMRLATLMVYDRLLATTLAENYGCHGLPAIPGRTA